MKMKQTLAAFVAVSLVGAPIAAQAAPAAADRTGSPVAESENIQGGWFIPLLAILAVILGVVTLVGGDGDDLPTSP